MEEEIRKKQNAEIEKELAAIREKAKQAGGVDYTTLQPDGETGNLHKHFSGTFYW